MQNIARIYVKNPYRTILKNCDGVASVGALRERSRAGVEEHGIAAFFEHVDMDVAADKEVCAVPPTRRRRRGT